MKKNIIFGIVTILFLVLPMSVKADNAVCLYKWGDYSAAIHVVNGKPVVDIYRPSTTLNQIWQFLGGGSNEFEARIHSIFKDTKGNDASSYFLGDSCPSFSFCDNRTEDIAWLVNPGTYCNGGMHRFDFVSQMSESSVSDLNVELAFSFKGGKGKINYTSILGSCPSNVGAFKLLGIGYGLLKIAAPIMLVLFASIDVAKAVTSADEGKMKKAQSVALKRIAAAVIVFLSFVIVEFIIGLASNGSETMQCVKQILG